MPPSSFHDEALQWVNFANLVSYFLNLAVTYGVGASGKFPTNGEISEKYQTLVTPAGYAFAIWGVIFTSQLIWAGVQMLPQYRSRQVVIHDGVGWNYVFVCAAQILWTILFILEQITFSFIAMVSILIPLVIILTKTSKISDETIGSYFLLKFPFEIHAAWVMAATLVNANVLLVACNVTTSTQVVAAWLSLVALATISVYYIYKQKWIVPSVLAWASYAINVELSHPKDSIVNTFSTESIEAIKISAEFLAALVILGTATSFIYSRYFVPDTSSAEAESLREPLT